MRSISVFTPTFNRELLLPRLFNSLIHQSVPPLEWVIVDDGSVDGTKDLVNKWQENNLPFRIVYHFQANGGKHRAINKGIDLCQGELFFIVDSDDYLPPAAIKTIWAEYVSIRNNENFAGISGLKIFENGEPTGGHHYFSRIDASLLDIKYRHKIKGDLAEVYKLSVLRNYKFPDIPEEKFCAEGLIWNRIAQSYKLRLVHSKIYICEYLPEGLSSMSVKNRYKNPIYASTIYLELFESNIPRIIKIKSGINFWRFYQGDFITNNTKSIPRDLYKYYFFGRLMRAIKI